MTDDGSGSGNEAACHMMVRAIYKEFDGRVGADCDRLDGAHVDRRGVARGGSACCSLLLV